MEAEELRKIIDQAIKEAHASGIQSGKLENSNLVADIMHKLETKIDTAVDKSVEKHVNGKIRALDAKVTAYIAQDTIDKEQILTWQKTATPYLDTAVKLKGFSTIGTTALKTIIVLGGATGVIAGLIKFLQN